MEQQVGSDTFRISGFECPPNFVCKSDHPSLLLPYFDPLVSLNDSGKERSGAEGLCISNLGGTLAAGWAITLCDLAEGYLFNGKVFF